MRWCSLLDCVFFCAYPITSALDNLTTSPNWFRCGKVSIWLLSMRFFVSFCFPLHSTLKCLIVNDLSASWKTTQAKAIYNFFFSFSFSWLLAYNYYDYFDAVYSYLVTLAVARACWCTLIIDQIFHILKRKKNLAWFQFVNEKWLSTRLMTSDINKCGQKVIIYANCRDFVN